MTSDRPSPFRPKLTAAFYLTVLANAVLIWLEKTTNFGESPLYLLLMVPLLLALIVTGFLMLREVFRQERPDS